MQNAAGQEVLHLEDIPADLHHDLKVLHTAFTIYFGGALTRSRLVTAPSYSGRSSMANIHAASEKRTRVS